MKVIVSQQPSSSVEVTFQLKTEEDFVKFHDLVAVHLFGGEPHNFIGEMFFAITGASSVKDQELEI